MEDLESLPGGDLIEQGVHDLRRGIESIAALLVSIGHPRLLTLGYELSDAFADPEKKLYSLLEKQYRDSAHSRYNALIGRLVSFERAAACAP